MFCGVLSLEQLTVPVIPAGQFGYPRFNATINITVTNVSATVTTTTCNVNYTSLVDVLSDIANWTVYNSTGGVITPVSTFTDANSRITANWTSESIATPASGAVQLSTSMCCFILM